MGWFKDLTGISSGDFAKFTAMGADPTALATTSAGVNAASNALSTPKSPTEMALNKGVEQGVGALSNLAFDANGNLITRGYMAPGQVTQSGLSALSSRALNDPMAALSEKYYADVLGGGTNPYLDRAYEQAAGKIRGSIASQFERAGRYGGSDHEIAMGGALGDLATNLYGGQYNQDQARMMQAAQLAPSAGFENIQRQLAAGSILDEQARAPQDWNYEQGMQAVERYLQALGVAKGGYVPQQQRNKLAEGLGMLSSIASIAGAIPTVGASLMALPAANFDPNKYAGYA